ncbi:hypothetical protein C8R45DRAFT_927685 [Mycena sanguinolenta]|nr:hypothetical protein C8R45DRAFT_927685 [Mycena sanguinolenta]
MGKKQASHDDMSEFRNIMGYRTDISLREATAEDAKKEAKKQRRREYYLRNATKIREQSRAKMSEKRRVAFVVLTHTDLWRCTGLPKKQGVADQTPCDIQACLALNSLPRRVNMLKTETVQATMQMEVISGDGDHDQESSVDPSNPSIAAADVEIVDDEIALDREIACLVEQAQRTELLPPSSDDEDNASDEGEEGASMPATGQVITHAPSGRESTKQSLVTRRVQRHVSTVRQRQRRCLKVGIQHEFNEEKVKTRTRRVLPQREANPLLNAHVNGGGRGRAGGGGGADPVVVVDAGVVVVAIKRERLASTLLLFAELVGNAVGLGVCLLTGRNKHYQRTSGGNFRGEDVRGAVEAWLTASEHHVPHLTAARRKLGLDGRGSLRDAANPGN